MQVWPKTAAPQIQTKRATIHFQLHLCVLNRICFRALFPPSEWQFLGSPLSGLCVCQPCLFYVTDAIFRSISWRVNLYLISLSPQYHLGWDSRGMVMNSVRVISCEVIELDYNTAAKIANLFFLASNSITYIYLSRFHTLMNLLFIFISSFTPTIPPAPHPAFAIIRSFPGQRYGRLCSFDLLSIRGLKINYAGSHA